MSEENLAAVLYGIDDIRMENVPVPTPGRDQLLVKMNTVGICGSDVHFWRNGCIGDFVVKAPMILGHESSGTVIGIGEDVKGFAIGDRIALEPGLSCKACTLCKTGHYNLCEQSRFFATPPTHGAIARYVVHDADFCFKVPDNVSFEEAALVEPLSVGIYACRRGGLRMGHKVLICGAGPIGILAAIAAKANGCDKLVITDFNEDRLNMAKQQGADFAVNVHGKSIAQLRNEIARLLGGEPEVTIECTGVQASVSLAIESTRNSGVVVLVGLGGHCTEAPLIQCTIREVDVRGIFRYVDCYPTAISLIASGRVNLSGLSRAHYRLDQAVEAFERTQKADVVKVFIHCDQ